MTTLAALERSDDVRKHAPVITRTLRTLSNVRVRNVATVGGALAHADPHMDLPPVLIALGASIATAGAGRRTRHGGRGAVRRLLRDVLERNELIAEVRVPAQGKKRAAYCKVTTGSADDWPALGVAVALEPTGRPSSRRRSWSSAATEKAMRLTGRRSRADRRDRRRQGAGARRRAAVAETEMHRRRARLGALQARIACASMSGAPCGRPSKRGAHQPMNTMLAGAQVGRSLPRLEARQKVTGRAEYTHTMRLPGMLSRQDLPQHRGARPHQVASTPARPGRCRACTASSPPTT